ncbi:phosphate acyltransferase [Caballeronia sp. LjRoot34]
MEVQAYPRHSFVTDAAINVTLLLKQKRDIYQNTIDLLHLRGIETPRVAVLAAVETANAAALTVMAARGQMQGAGQRPLVFDNAISLRPRGPGHRLAGYGQADILPVPDLKAGNMLAKQMIYSA